MTLCPIDNARIERHAKMSMQFSLMNVRCAYLPVAHIHPHVLGRNGHVEEYMSSCPPSMNLIKRLIELNMVYSDIRAIIRANASIDKV